MNDRQRALSECFTVIFAEIDIIHVIVVQDQSGAVLVDFRYEFHLCCNPCINTGQFSCKDADFIQRSTGFLSANTDISFSCFYISKSLRHDTWRIIEIPQFVTIEIIKVRYFFYRIFRKGAFRHFQFCKVASICHTKPVIFCPHHFLDCSLTSQSTTKFRNKWSGAEMNQIYFSCRKFHITSMTGFL